MKVIAAAGWMVLASARPVSAAEPELDASPREAKPVDYVIVVTGGELLAGVYADSHTPFLARTLQLCGCRCVGALMVDDDPEDLRGALRFATNRAALVLVTGGLGPTANDITRDTVSEFTGLPLREDPGVLAEMERRFGQTKDQLRPNLRRQTLVPARGTFLKNPGGTAVGLVFDSGGPVIVALPGPPRELQPMVKGELIPYLERRFGVRTLGSLLTLRFVGAGQSLIDQTIKDHLSLAPDIRVTSLFEDGRVDFTFSLPGDTPADRARLQKLEADIRQRLGPYIYAQDGSSLEEVVLRQMEACGTPWMVAEIGSGGGLAVRLGRADTAGRCLGGAYSAPSLEGMERLLGGSVAGAEGMGAELAKRLAAAVAKANQMRPVIVVGPVEVGTDGARRVWVVLRFGEDRVEAEPLGVRGAGEVAQASLATQILDWLRRRLQDRAE